MANDLDVLVVEEMIKELRQSQRDLAEEIQNLGLSMQLALEGQTTEIWQDYEDVCESRRIMSNKIEDLRTKLRELLKF